MIPLFIPYVNRIDLLNKAVKSAQWAPTIVINNSGGIVHTDSPFVRTAEVPLTFAQTQNWMLRIADESNAPFYLFMHSDAEAEDGVVAKLVEMAAIQSVRGKWGAIFTAYDALTAFNTEAMTAIGGWDPFLEWYHADTDCYRRLRLAGYPTIDSGLPVKHTPSQTLNSDPTIARKVNLMFPCRVAYYRAKWGGDAGQEMFSVPWNGQ